MNNEEQNKSQDKNQESVQAKDQGVSQTTTEDKSQTAKDEEKVLDFWNKNKTFQKTLDKKSPKGEYVFYDGPPFATGLPHHGHILASAIKDAVPRYQTMRGYHVERLWGWDTHGLPIENIVEKALGISGKKQIEEIGVEKFNKTARAKVLEYVAEWKKTVDRIGRWVDFDNSYKTMDNTYIESVWWALNEVNKKGLLYEGFKVLPYCSRCETPIANSEIAMDNSYKDISDLSVTVKLELLDDVEGSKTADSDSADNNLKTYILAWTTTPWTLPANSACAVNEEIDYVKIKISESESGNVGFFILAKARLEVVKDKYEIVSEFKGSALVGKSYKPLFNYFSNTDTPNKENGWKVYSADYVTTEAGTGIVHLAPAYGEEDMVLAKSHKIPFFLHVESNGTFKKEVTDFAGMPIKPKDNPEKGIDHMQTDIEIIKFLAHNGLLFAKEKIRHSYPHCFRCDTPLYYSALSAWFINIQEVKHKLLKLNDDIHWVPGHLKEGRFKKSMEGAPDWNISRNRYWASPLPFWKSEDGDLEVISSIAEIKEKKKSTNTYTLIRHGESKSNASKTVSSLKDNDDHLTDIGKSQVEDSIKELKKRDIDLIIASPFIRTTETALIIKEKLGIGDDQILFDERLGELSVPSFNGDVWANYKNFFGLKDHKYFSKSREGEENYYDVKRRAGEFLYDIDSKYSGKNILIVTHGLVLTMLHTVAEGMDFDQTVKCYDTYMHSYANAQVGKLDFSWLPHNSDFEMDLHRPYIDEFTFEKNGKMYKRIPEVVDCWVESGSMPFAQKHYPFENEKEFKKSFPSQFVAEYIAQTRTWFYYTHALSTILFKSHPFDNVVTTGNILAEDGSKMSKSKNNFPDPWIIFSKYGVDALRFYLLSAPVMRAEDLNFSEKGVDEIYKKIVMRLKNIVSFYEMYKGSVTVGEVVRPESKNILDKWMIARLDEVTKEVTDGMEAYELDRACRPIVLLIDDLSTWYLRRSRDRFKSEDLEDRANAMMTLRYVTLETAKLLAPFTPFISEEVYQRITSSNFANGENSVHLLSWSKTEKADKDVLELMATIRDFVTKALEARDKVGIKVRQPLASLTIKSKEKEMTTPEVFEILKDEVNVKEVFVDKDQAEDVLLDTTITDELRREGAVRELIRFVQSLRKTSGLVPDDRIILTIDTDEEGRRIITPSEAEIAKITGTARFVYAEVNVNEVEIMGGVKVRVVMQKV